MTHTAADTIRALLETARRAPSADNMQPLHYHWDGQRLALRYDRERVGGITFAAGAPATLLAVGCALELILETATARGLEPQLAMAPTLPDAGLEYGAFTFRQLPGADTSPLASSPAPESRHTNRGPFTREPLPEPLVAGVDGMRQGQARIHLLTGRDDIRHVARLVRLASELRFRIREVHEWLAHSLRFSPEAVARGDGLDVRTLGLPPGGILFLRFISHWQRMNLLNKFGGYKLVSAIDASPVGAAPALAVIIAPRNPESACDAGRLLHRGWQTLNRAGMGVHPYYVIADQLERLADGRMPDALEAPARTLEAETRRVLQLAPDETLHMLLRTGQPKHDAPPSLRLTLEQVYTHTT